MPHQEEPTEFLFFADGAMLLTAGEDNTIRLWNIKKASQVRQFSHSSSALGGGGITSISLSKDERKLAAVFELAFTQDTVDFSDYQRESKVVVFDLATGQVTSDPFTPYKDSCDRVLFLPDDRLLTASTSDGIKIWSKSKSKDGKESWQHNGSIPFETSVVATDPSGKVLAASDDEATYLIDIESGQKIEKFSGIDSNQLHFSPCGKRLVSESTGDSFLIDIDNKKLLASLGDLYDSTLCYSPDGQLLAVAHGTAVMVFNTTSGDKTNHFQFPHSVECVSLATQRKLIVLFGEFIDEIDLAKDMTVETKRLSITNSSRFKKDLPEFSSTGRVNARQIGDLISITNTFDDKNVSKLNFAEREVGLSCFSPCESLFAVGDLRGDLHVFDLKKRAKLQRVSAAFSIYHEPKALAINSDFSKIISGYESGLLLSYTKDGLRVINSSLGEIEYIRFFQDCSRLVAADVYGSVSVFDGKTLAETWNSSQSHKNEIAITGMDQIARIVKSQHIQFVDLNPVKQGRLIDVGQKIFGISPAIERGSIFAILASQNTRSGLTIQKWNRLGNKLDEFEMDGDLSWLTSNHDGFEDAFDLPQFNFLPCENGVVRVVSPAALLKTIVLDLELKRYKKFEERPSGFFPLAWNSCGFLPNNMGVWAFPSEPLGFPDQVRGTKVWGKRQGLDLKYVPWLENIYEHRFRNVGRSNNGDFCVSRTTDNRLVVWDTKKIDRVYDESIEAISPFAVSNDGDIIAYCIEKLNEDGSSESSVLIKNWRKGQSICEFECSERPTDVVFSPDTSRVLVSVEKGAFVGILDTGQEKTLQESLGLVNDVAFSDDGTKMFTCTASVSNKLGLSTPVLDHSVFVWDSSSLQLLKKFDHKASVNDLHFHGESLFSACADGTISEWSLDSLEKIRDFKGHFDEVRAIEFHQQKMLSCSQDGTVRLWDLGKKTELAAMTADAEEEWLVYCPDGRFDSSSLESLETIRWVFANNPFSPVNPEFYLKDFFEPKLLVKVLNDDDEPTTQHVDIAKRYQPKSFRKLNVTKSSKTSVDVSFSVVGESEDGKGIPVFDVKLFRNGKLIRSKKAKACDANNEESMEFRNIELSSESSGKDVVFSAYGFSEGGVKNKTVSAFYEAPNQEFPSGKVFIISIGIDEFDSKDFNLKFAANDARRIGDLISESFSKSKGVSPEQVTSFYLTSQSNDSPSRANIRDALNLLAYDLAPFDRKEILGRLSKPAKKVVTATPNDTVIVFFSTHGQVSKRDGGFYLMPTDIGEGWTKSLLQEDPESLEKLLHRCISSEELSDWASKIDAKEIVYLFGTCYSAESVAAGGIKHGPFSQKGFGQLAFDKKMRVLAASERAAYELVDQKAGELATALKHTINTGLDRRANEFTLRELLLHTSRSIQLNRSNYSRKRTAKPIVREQQTSVENPLYQIYFDFGLDGGPTLSRVP